MYTNHAFQLSFQVAKCKLLRDEVLYFIRTTRLTDYSTIIPAGILPSLSPTLLKTLVKATKDLDRSELDVLEMARLRWFPLFAHIWKNWHTFYYI